MVNGLSPSSPERELALSYAPAKARAAMGALLALDDRFGGIVRATREPMAGQMRLTWWFEALERLDREPPPAEPVLRGVAEEALPRGVTGAALATMVDGWEVILGDDPLDDDALRAFAAGRGGQLFEALATVCGADDRQVRAAGEGWALADLAANLSRPEDAVRARAIAAERLGEAMRARWSREGRGLGALALMARFELESGSGFAKLGRLVWHRMTGR